MPDALSILWIPPAVVSGAVRADGAIRNNPIRRYTNNLPRAASPGKTFAETLHAVQQGETLSGIVRSHLESTGQNTSSAQVMEGVRQVARSNHLANPDSIQIRQRIDLSCLDFARQTPLPQNRRTEILPAPAQSFPTALEPSAPARSETGPQTVAELRARLAADVRKAKDKRAEIPASQPQAPATRTERVRNPHGRRVDLLELVRRILHPHERRAENNQTESPIQKSNPLESNGGSEPWQALLDHDAWISSRYGMRDDPFSGHPAFHSGIDLAAPEGTAIRPMHEGTVVFSGWKPGYGRTVMVRHEDGSETLYGHTRSTHVRKGDRVTENTMIARVGSTGRATGPHLHFEIRQNGHTIDPEQFLAKDVPIRLAKAR